MARTSAFRSIHANDCDWDASAEATLAGSGGVLKLSFAVIDRIVRVGYEARFIREQKRRDSGGFFHSAHAAHRNGCFEYFAELRGDFFRDAGTSVKRCVNRTRANGVDPHAFGTELAR